MLYKNMKIVTSCGIRQCDIKVENGKIAALKKSIAGPGKDFKGKYVLPAVTDLHVHARDFNESHKETVKTCTQAAVAGGVATVVDMPNTNPPVITQPMFEKRKTLFEQDAVCDFALNFGVVNTLEEIRNVNPLFVKVYLEHTTGGLLFRGNGKALMDMKVPVAIHSNLETTRKWCIMNQGVLYVCHVASRPEIEFLESQKVIKEVTPHHLFLTSSDDPLSQVNPPLGTDEDRRALWAHLQSIDVIASDHAPHTLEEKLEGAYGIAGIETMLPLLLNAHSRNKILLQDIVRILCENPSRLLNSLLRYRKGFFVGADADFTVIDLKKEWVIKASEFYSKAAHSPFDGWKIKGAVTETIVKGVSVFKA